MKLKLILVTFSLVFIHESFTSDVEDKFRSSKIVDDLIPKPPDSLLDIQFDCGFTTLGNKFTPLQVRNRPSASWKQANDNDSYTLIMTDAEGSGKEWLHWLVGNIHGNAVDKGDLLVNFFPSAPPKDSGEHRYVFLLFKEPEKINFKGYEKISTFEMEGRDKFSTKGFVEKHKLGTPVAGNFYLASWDESCDEMYKLVEENEKKIK
jgi:phosphatidylethanolamine-binding protein